jgi:hypothetical protein
MIDVRRNALIVVRQKFVEQHPEGRDKWTYATTPTVLKQPADSRGVLYGTVEWPIDEDPYASCNVRINFPRERLKNGQGYVGTTYEYSVSAGDNTGMTTKLKIIYGVGNIGLLEPLSASMTEQVERNSEPLTEAIWSQADSEVTSMILAKFGIEETPQ